MNRRLIAVEHRLVHGLQSGILGHDLLDPGFAGWLVSRRLELIHDLLEDCLGVSDDADVDVPVLADLATVHHDLDELGVLREDRR